VVGAEAAIAELSLCGTINGTNVSYMVNHTVREWIKKMENRSTEKNMHINVTLKEIRVTPIDAWNFSITLDTDIKISDDTGICYYQGLRRTTTSKYLNNRLGGSIVFPWKQGPDKEIHNGLPGNA